MKSWVTNPAKQRQSILVVGDIVIFLAFVLATATVQASSTSQTPVSFLLEAVGAGWITSFLGIQLLVLYISDLYRVDGRSQELLHYGSWMLVAEGVVLGIGAIAWVAFGTGMGGRQLLFLQIPVMLVGGTLWRTVFFSLQSTPTKRLAVIGEDNVIEEVARQLQNIPVRDYELVGRVRDLVGPETELALDLEKTNSQKVEVVSSNNGSGAAAKTTEKQAAGIRREQTGDGFSTESSSIVDPNRLDTVICTSRPEKSNDTSMVSQAIWLRQEGIEVCDLISFTARHFGRIPVSAVTANWVLQETHVERTESVSGRLSRIFDVVGSTLAMVLALPLMALIAIAIKLDSPGPVLFTQKRLGLNRKPFTVYKFRTMVEDAEEKTGPTWADEKDPRVTRVGNFLRKTRLDELPQLFNILRGEMSIVGFRPIRKHFADMLGEEIPFYRLRFNIKPGLTGWPQVQHDYAGSVDGQKKKFEYELFYMREKSFLLDIYIIIKTLKVVTMGEGK
jgi:exopolysaccharide biosynthesis polyprenyl glycosylphosphotransferase